jgi:hypothetical protein
MGIIALIVSALLAVTTPTKPTTTVQGTNLDHGVIR